jgi:hypothetical protein
MDNAILQFKISIDIVEDLQFQTFVLIEILNFKTALLFEICLFLYFLKLSAGRGFET